MNKPGCVTSSCTPVFSQRTHHLVRLVGLFEVGGVFVAEVKIQGADRVVEVRHFAII